MGLTCLVPAAKPSPSPAGPLGDIAAMTYEQARDELVSVVATLEAGSETLEGSLALWERGEALARRCQEWLDGARRRLDAARAAGTESDRPATSATEENAG